MFSDYKGHWKYILDLKFQSFFSEILCLELHPHKPHYHFRLLHSHIPMGLQMLEGGPSWMLAVNCGYVIMT